MIKQPDDLRVLLIDLSTRFGGASVRALTLAANMQPGSAAIAGLEGSPVVRIAKERHIPTRIVGKSRTDPSIPFRLRRVIRKEGFQVIDTQNIISKFWGSLVAVITPVAFVSTLNSSYLDEQGPTAKGKLYSTLDRLTNFRTQRYIAVSVPIKRGLLETGIPEEKVDVITNAVEIFDKAQTEEPAQVRKQLGIPEDAFVCVSVGRLVWAKGFDDFISAFAIASQSIPNAYALIMGDGVLHAALAEQIKAAGLEQRFLLLGHCDQLKVMSVEKASDLYVLSSRSEGVPFALLEAAAAGLPIVSTCCGGVPEILTDNENGLLVPIGDPQAIASVIVKLQQDRQLAKRLGAAARAKIERDHSVQKQVEETRYAYRKAFEHKQMA